MSRFSLTVLIAASGLVFASATAVGQTVLTDPLDGSTSGNKDGGSFTGGGWQAPQQIGWDLGKVLTTGTFSVEVTNWNPNDDSPQHKHPKQQIINMYEAPSGSPHDSDATSPKTGFFNIRTGATYDNCFKFLSSPAGFTDRIETRVKKPYGTISATETHTISISWTADGTITAFLDGVAQVTHEHKKPFALRYVFIGTDNAPAGTYGPQHGVIYKNLVVSGDGEPDPDPAPDPIDPLLLAPVDDTWADPTAPTTPHGSSDELRVGGDGRTILLKFDVKDVGPIAKATLRLEALNGGGGGEVRTVLDTTWTEAGLTFEKMPPASGPVLDALGKVETGQTYELDVSLAVACDGEYAFAISSSDLDGAGYWSSESGKGGPQLILVPDPTGDGCGPTPPEPGPEPPPPSEPPPEAALPPEPMPEPPPAPETAPDQGSEERTDIGGLPVPDGGATDAGGRSAPSEAPSDGGCSAGPHAQGGGNAPWLLVVCALLGFLARGWQAGGER